MSDWWQKQREEEERRRLVRFNTVDTLIVTLAIVLGVCA